MENKSLDEQLEEAKLIYLPGVRFKRFGVLKGNIFTIKSPSNICINSNRSGIMVETLEQGYVHIQYKEEGWGPIIGFTGNTIFNYLIFN